MCYPRVAPENSSAALCTIQELITWSKKKNKRGWFSYAATKVEITLTNNALLSSFIPDTNIFFKNMIYKNKYLFHTYTHTHIMYQKDSF